jgi:hypothetical protein
MSARKHAHILIIEDDPGIATSLRSGLDQDCQSSEDWQS